ncbi:Propeller [Cooperia oncophora]
MRQGGMGICYEFRRGSLEPDQECQFVCTSSQMEKTYALHGMKMWPRLPPEETTTFVELAVGGFDMLCDRSYLLFALSKDGYVYRRVGIGGNNPGGDFWSKIPEIECEEGREDLAKISCSASLGTLVALTWDGRLFLRVGITKGISTGIRKSDTYEIVL